MGGDNKVSLSLPLSLLARFQPDFIPQQRMASHLTDAHQKAADGDYQGLLEVLQKDPLSVNRKCLEWVGW